MKKICLLFLSSVVMLLDISLSFAIPPSTVWRMDTRGEQEIFSSGFQAWGNNVNVHAHVSGESCVNRPGSQRNSGFVSTAADFQYIRTVAAARAFARPGQHIFLYRIRADGNFYNVEASLRALHGNNPQTPVSPLNYQPSVTANEYITPGAIPPRNIRDVESYVVVDGQLQVSTARANPAYMTGNTNAAATPFVNGVAGQTGRSTWVGMIPIVGACLALPRSDLKLDELQVSSPMTLTLESIVSNRLNELNHDEL